MFDISKNVCRICLEESNTLTPLNTKKESWENSSSPYKKLLIILKIEVAVTQPSICVECLQELENCVKFVEKCERANKILAAQSAQYYSSGSLTGQNECFEQDSEVLDVRFQAEVADPKAEVDHVLNSKISEKQSPKKQCPECKSRRGCVHRPPVVYTCQFCHKDFTRKFNFEVHIKRHLGHRSHPCPVCGAAQVSRSLARRHCAPRPRRRCPEPGCRRQYTSTHNLNTHLLTHTGEKPHECLHCGKRFTSKTTLNDHIRTHTGARPYLCSICGASFATNKLRAHARTHAHAPRPPAHAPRKSPEWLSCEQCGRRYRHPQSLRRHRHSKHPTATTLQMPDCPEGNLKAIDCFM